MSYGYQQLPLDFKLSPVDQDLIRQTVIHTFVKMTDILERVGEVTPMGYATDVPDWECDVCGLVCDKGTCLVVRIEDKRSRCPWERWVCVDRDACGLRVAVRGEPCP